MVRLRMGNSKPKMGISTGFSNAFLLGFFSLIVFIFATGGLLFYNSPPGAIHKRITSDLQAVSTLNVDPLTPWRQPWLTGTIVNPAGLFFDRTVGQWMSDPGSLPSTKLLDNPLQRIAAQGEYRSGLPSPGLTMPLFIFLVALLTISLVATAFIYRRQLLYKRLYLTEQQRSKEQAEMNHAMDTNPNDINERKRIQKELQESETRLLQAQAIGHLGYWEITLSDNLMWGSTEAFRIYGIEQTSPYLPLKQVQQVPVVEDRPRLDAALQGLLEGTGVYDVEYRIRRENDGTERIIHTIARLDTDEQGVPVKVIGILQDVTDLRKIEHSLVESEQRYRALFEKAYAVMMLVDPESGEIVDANPAACEFYGWTHTELLQINVYQINTLPPEAVRSEMQLASNQQRRYFFFQHRKKNGNISDVEVFSGPIQLSGRTLLYSIVHDITARKQAEAKVAEQVNELRQWYNLTLGRETRIMDLKQEVNNLLVQLGKPARYATTMEDDKRE